MSPRRMVDPVLLAQKRQLRAEVVRTRDTTRRTLALLGEERRRLTSWQTYVRRFPVASLGMAFGVGLFLAAGRPGRRLPRAVATNLIQWGLASARSQIVGDLLDIWTGSSTGKNGPDSV